MPGACRSGRLPGRAATGASPCCWRALSMVSPFSIDTFFPSFHAIAAEFHLTPWQIQQTLTVYMVPLAFMSLIQGPLSDCRRPPSGDAVRPGVYSLASLGCALAPSFARCWLSERSRE